MLNTRVWSCAIAAAVLGPAFTSCALIEKDVSFPEDSTGKNIVGISTGWAFVEADIDLENGTGPLANPIFGGSDVGSSTTDLDPVFGLGVKYYRYITNNFLLGAIFEYRVFDPDPTSPLAAEVDIDEFGTNHLIVEARYQFNPIDSARRFRPYAGVQLGFVPEVRADGVARYEPVDALGIPATEEDIMLDGSSFFTLGFILGGSYLLREGLTFDFSAFYEYALTPTEDTLVLDPFDVPPLNEPSTFDGELLERGLYLTAGLSLVF
ncbi:MAG: hypothetical protein AAF726_22875 [Planctomycetota bacterium]